MAGPVLVIGATGEVGEGIVAQLVRAERDVIAVARRAEALDALVERLGHPAHLRTSCGSIADMAAAGELADAAGQIGAVIVAVNAPRTPERLSEMAPDRLATLLQSDLLTHFIALRTFVPRLPHDGCFVGIGGGAADFILDGGIALSMAQAALRQMYRGFAHELGDDGPAVRELIVASVVAGRAHGQADPLWVTPDEIGERVLGIIDNPRGFPGPIWRIARRDESGVPVFGCEQTNPAKVLPL